MGLKETYNLIAEDWHKDHSNDDWWMAGTDTFISLLTLGSEVLDVGCGGGTKSKYLVNKGLRVTGIDVSEKMIDIARREVPQATFEVLGLEDAGQLERQFDAVLMQAVLLHVPKKDAAREIARMVGLVKPGGYLYVAVKERWPGQPEEKLEVEDSYGYKYERFFSYFVMPEIESYLKNANLEIVFSEITPSGNTNWLQIIGKK